MDLRDDSQDASLPISPTFKVKTLKMIAAASLKTRFYENVCRHQRFAFPDSLMYRIAKNPKTPEMYRKMVMCCKYFFIANPLLVVDTLLYGYRYPKWTYEDEQKTFALGLDDIGCKIWITKDLMVYKKFPCTGLQNTVSSIVPKIYRCDARILRFQYQTISFEEYCCLSRCAETIDFTDVMVKNGDGSITPLEKLVKASPKLRRVTFTPETIPSNITSNTVQELVELPYLWEFDELYLDAIPEAFDIEAFYVYMKTSNSEYTIFNLNFDNRVSDGYKKRLEEIVDELIEERENGPFEYTAVSIDFDDLDDEKRERLNGYESDSDFQWFEDS